ncbi:hypothetical protein [Chryseobacterium sp. Mn2064]|uniref:hypothetical protein n=1 Tax=Chryseobacterium sp. Mn2064 TaxID=3395263 RepID=UPI003BE0B87C
MGIFNSTLILLKEKKAPASMILELNENLKSIGILLQKSDYARIIFNDSRNEEEKEPITLQKSHTDEEVIGLLSSWKGLGLLSYRHINIEFPFLINYISWDDQYLQGLEISYQLSAENYTNRDHIKDDILLKIIEFINPLLAVGSIGNSEDEFRVDLGLEYNLDYIKNKKFDIDIRL